MNELSSPTLGPVVLKYRAEQREDLLWRGRHDPDQLTRNIGRDPSNRALDAEIGFRLQTSWRFLNSLPRFGRAVSSDFCQ
jgi:hypothetical protein